MASCTLSSDRPRVSLSKRAIPAVSKLCALAFGMLISAALLSSALAQEARWYQLSEQVVQLQRQERSAEAIPIAQQAVRVAEATYGPADRHLGLSLNVLGILLSDRESLADAETTLQRALGVMTKASGSESGDVASVLDNLGNVYRKQGRYPEAEKATQQALVIHQKANGANDPSVATDAGNLALIYVAEGKYAEAEPLCRLAIAIDEKQPQAGNRDLSVDLSNLGDLYLKEGKYAEAEPVLLKALSTDLSAVGKDHPLVALDLSNLANAFLYEGKFAQAEPVLQRAMAIVTNAKNIAPDIGITVLQTTAALDRDEGKYPESEHLYLQVLANRQKALGPDHPDVALVLDNLGSVFSAEGRYSDAETAYRRALDIRVKKLGQQHPLVGLTMINLAELYSQHGRWGDAEALYLNAMNIYLKAYGQQDIRVADLLRTAASLMIDEGKLPGAEKVLRGAVAISEKAKGPNDPAVASNLNLLAEVISDQGKLAESESLYKRAIDIVEKAPGSRSTDLADYQIGLASDYQNEQKFADAEPLFQKAIATLDANLTPNSPQLGEAQMNLALFYYAWDKPERAEPYFEKRIGNLMAQFRANAATMSEKDRLIFLATTPGAFPMYYSFVLKYHDRMPELSGKMYDALLQEKGLIAESSAALRAGIEASGDKQALAMLDKLAAEKTELAALVESKIGDPANRRAQIAQLEQETNQLEQELARHSSAVSDQKALAVVTWRDVQKTLKPGEAAVEIVRFPLHDGKSFRKNQLYVALVVRPDSNNPNLVFLGDAKDLESAPMLAYRNQVAQTRGLTAEAEPNAPAAGSQTDTSAAYAAFWKPLEPALAGINRVYISPDGVLNQIPFGLFADSNGKLLLEKYQLRYVNSSKDLLRRSRPAPSKSAVLVGNPKFDLTEAEQRTEIAQTNRAAAHPEPAAIQTPPPARTAQRSIDLTGAPLNPLPGTQIEVDAVAKLLANAGWQPNSYTGDRALKQTVLRVRSPRIVHFATHGFFLSDAEIAQQARAIGAQHAPVEDPMLRSGLLFAGADRIRAGTPSGPGLDDGVLTAYEASQLDLEGTELVVLSACETGLGQQSNSEGIFGLRRGLQEAGAEAVMMSMWSVPDRETQELMALFYAKWLGGLDKPEALRQAQLAEREVVRKRYGKDLPYYWGAFILVSP